MRSPVRPGPEGRLVPWRVASDDGAVTVLGGRRADRSVPVAGTWVDGRKTARGVHGNGLVRLPIESGA
jgi:hypothetical protein